MTIEQLFAGIGLTLPVVAGFVLMRFGRRLPRTGDWLVWITIFSSGAAIALARAFDLSTAVGWLGSWDEAVSHFGTLRMGLLHDDLGLALGLFFLSIIVLLIANRKTLSHEPNVERVYAALAFFAAGVPSLALGQSIWLSYFGLLLIIVSAFLSLATRWSSLQESRSSARLLLQLLVGLSLAAYGSFVLLSYGADLSWGSQAGSVKGHPYGTLMVLFGLFLITTPFPFLGWVVLPSDTLALVRVLLAQAIPGLASIALLIRLYPLLQGNHAWIPFGIVALVSSVLAAISGLAQKRWESSLGLWWSSATSLAIAALAFSGPAAALAMVVTLFLGLFGFLLLAYRRGAQALDPIDTGLLWALASAAGGVAVFSSGSGLLRVLSTVAADPFLVGGVSLAILLSTSLVFKAALALQKPLIRAAVSDQLAASKMIRLPLAICLLASMSWVGTGLVFGGLVLGANDRVLPSLLDRLTSAGADSGSLEMATSAQSIYFGLLVAAVGLAFWFSRTEAVPFFGFETRSPRAYSFVAGGFGADRLAAKVSELLAKFSQTLVEWVDVRLWQKWIPAVFRATFERIALAFVLVDQRFVRGMNTSIAKLVDTPAKAIQIVHSGDVQWYLVFAIASGGALMLHFLRF